MNLTQSSAQLFLAKISGTLISFIGILYFARELGAAILGGLFIFQALTGVLSIATNLGTRTAIEKRISEDNDPPGVLSTGIVLKTPLVCVVVFLILLFSDPIDQYIGFESAGLVALAVIARESGHFMANILKGELRVDRAAVLEIVNKVGWIGAAAVFTWAGYGVEGLVYGVIVGFFSKFLVGLYYVSTPLGSPSRNHLYSIWAYAKYSIIPSLDEYIHNWTDILIMGLFLSSAAVGAYEISWRILTPIFILTTAVGATIFPQISAWDAGQEADRIEQLFPKALIPSLIFVIPAFFGAVALSTEILGLLFGEGFEAAALALPILIAGLIPRALREVAGKTLQGIDQPRFVNRASVVDMVANIVLNAILITQIGLVGAAIATSLSYTIGATLRWYYLDRFLTIRVPYREIGWCTISAIGMYFTLRVVKSQLSIESVPLLFAVVVLGACLYGLFVLLYEPLRITLFQYADRLLPASVRQAL